MADIGRKTRSSSVTRAIGVLGDRWSILIVRDAFQGVRRFQDFLERTGTSRTTLSNRLRALVSHGIFRRVQYQDAPARWEYRLTDKGRDLYALSLAAWRWERRWAPRGAGIPARLYHLDCGHSMLPETSCGHCGEALGLRDVSYRDGPGANARAPALAARARRLSALTSADQRGSQSSLTHIADIVGDPWTPLVLAAAFFGLRRFDDIQRELGIATNILSVRLDLLVRQKIFRRRQYSRQPARYEYRLTGKGRDLFPYALVLNAWGDRWLSTAAGPPYHLLHRGCGQVIEPVVRCSHCHGALLASAVAAAPRGKSRPRAGLTAASRAV